MFKLCAFDNPSEEERELMTRLGPFAISPGVHLLVDADTEKVIEPALLWLKAKHGKDGVAKDGGVAQLRSSRASAYELAEWLRFLAKMNVRWDHAHHDLIHLFAHNLATGPSYHTGRNREGSTISHKLSVVYGFYNWWNAVGLTKTRWDVSTIRAAYRNAKGGREACDIEIRPFSPDELKHLLQLLGPLPSELPKKSIRPTRDRLVFETALLTGMRGEEIAYLSAKAISKLKPVLSRPDETQRLQIFVTKRRIARWVALPNNLIHELQLYIAGERARSMGKNPTHDRLFVNLAGHPGAGSPMTTSTIHKRTHALMIRAGLAEQDTKTIDGELVRYMRTLHSFHDTRHTYAVHLYIGQKRAGDTEPWKTVQVMLGHADWTTTERYYLRSVGIFEPRIGVKLNRYWEDVA